MLYLLGINLPDKKFVSIALRSVYGIGPKTAFKICNQLLIHPQCRLDQLSETKITQLSKILNTMTIEAELKRQVSNNINDMIRIKTTRGLRHAAGLPVRGQHTHTNANTAAKLNKKRIASAFS